ncbi:MAG: LysR family transcriptional regulator [Gammaproteobacteria bacterium]|nr:LysR family transcriptional regulator [Gammaproteobacteria bacterium]
MNISRVDLNLLVYFDVLLEEKNVTRAGAVLGITQPAMSNGLRRLRELFDDPLLVRTTEGMTPTEKALNIQPKVRQILTEIEQVLQPTEGFEPEYSNRLFRIIVGDYAESTLIPEVLRRLRHEAPHVVLDLLTPSDASIGDLEQGKVDLAINRFDELPQSFHSVVVWRDTFSCLMSDDNPLVNDMSLENYLKAQHIWVSKTGVGRGTGINTENYNKLGWVDRAVDAAQEGARRNIAIFTRHYQMPGVLLARDDLVATLPTRVAKRHLTEEHLVVSEPPFAIPPIELNMAWSPLLQHNPAHRWLRRLIMEVASTL